MATLEARMAMSTQLPDGYRRTPHFAFLLVRILTTIACDASPSTWSKSSLLRTRTLGVELLPMLAVPAVTSSRRTSARTKSPRSICSCFSASKASSTVESGRNITSVESGAPSVLPALALPGPELRMHWIARRPSKSATGHAKTGCRRRTALDSASSTPVQPNGPRTLSRSFSQPSRTAAGALGISTTESVPAPSVYVRCPFRCCS
mmetsp:Transcript_103303/g.287554  ORF Transcript_103303/g.287554 Transcript_103303/m.287554 type:complete len:206 (-) Transcript_103303:597-1214(-)